MFRPGTERPCGRIALASSDYEPSRAAKTYTGGNDESSAREPTVCPTQHSTPQFLVAAHRRIDRRIRSGRRGNTDGNRANGGDRLQHVPRPEQRKRSEGCCADEDDRGVRAPESQYQGSCSGRSDGGQWRPHPPHACGFTRRRPRDELPDARVRRHGRAVAARRPGQTRQNRSERLAGAAIGWHGGRTPVRAPAGLPHPPS